MIEKLNGLIWGYPLLLMLLGTGLYFTVKTRFFQLLKFPYILKNTLFSLFRGRSAVSSKDKDSISQLQSLSTALAATMGTGNIVGVATAIKIGGAGAVFWMWISAFLGMAIVYAENYLGTIYRKKIGGIWYGGPMAYLEHGVRSYKLAAIFALFCALASLGMGNMAQANSISTAASSSFGIPVAVTGLAVAIAAWLVISGGIKRIGNVTQLMIPILSLLYIGAALIIIIINSEAIPHALGEIFRGAFGIRQAAGGISGAVLCQGINAGLRRGVFSNEAGLGSSALLHSASDNKSPASQGMWSIFEVFTDTIICCTLTALVILVTGADSGELDGAPLVIKAFEHDLGSFAPIFITLSILLFAFATIIGWFFCGESSVRYIFGERGTEAYKYIFILFIIIGAGTGLETVWTLSDIFNGLMALPNLTGLIILRKHVSAPQKSKVE